jgi:hypothetical protein
MYISPDFSQLKSSPLLCKPLMRAVFLTIAGLFAFTGASTLYLPAARADEGDGESKPAEKGKKKAEKGDKGDKSDSEKSNGDTYSVVQIGDDVKVVKSSEVAGLRKKVDEDFQVTLKTWNDSKVAAAKAKKKFNDSKPVKPNLLVIAQAIKKMEDAEAIRDKKLKEIEAHKKKSKNGKNGESKGSSKK